jgi:hypothetical protein
VASTSDDDKKLLAKLVHFKQLRKVAGLLSFLHDNGCDRDKAGNRELHFDDYVLLMLLWMFNPALDSMRALQRVAKMEELQKKLNIKPFSLGSFSESCRQFDPSMLNSVVKQLAGEMTPIARQEMFKKLPGILELVDGTLLKTLRTVVEAMWLPGSDGEDAHRTHAWKLHLNFDVGGLKGTGPLSIKLSFPVLPPAGSLVILHIYSLVLEFL